VPVRTGADLGALEKDRNKIGLLLALEGASSMTRLRLLHNYYVWPLEVDPLYSSLV